MFSFVRRLLLLVGVALQAGSLAGCGTLNERLAAGVSDAIPTWAGGLPADAPPRPGTAQYDEYMRERERQRLLSASERSQTSAASDAASGQAPQENR
jgi:hypothetical protein